jgi:hypothetical protein
MCSAKINGHINIQITLIHKFTCNIVWTSTILSLSAEHDSPGIDDPWSQDPLECYISISVICTSVQVSIPM